MAGKTSSGIINVGTLDFDIPEDFGVGEAAFAAACRADPWRTTRWFKRLRLPLAKPERGCLDGLCPACGF